MQQSNALDQQYLNACYQSVIYNICGSLQAGRGITIDVNIPEVIFYVQIMRFLG